MPLRVIGYDWAAYRDLQRLKGRSQAYVGSPAAADCAETGDSRFLETMDVAGEGGEVRNMCEVLERIEEKGIKKGMIKGREQGIESVNMLNARLIQDGRIADLERSVTDSAYQKQLLYELFPEFRKQK